MIRYRCNFCGASMESPETMIGQSENCPECGAVQAVGRAGPDRRNTSRGPRKFRASPARPGRRTSEADRVYTIIGMFAAAIVLAMSLAPWINLVVVSISPVNFARAMTNALEHGRESSQPERRWPRLFEKVVHDQDGRRDLRYVDERDRPVVWRPHGLDEVPYDQDGQRLYYASEIADLERAGEKPPVISDAAAGRNSGPPGPGKIKVGFGAYWLGAIAAGIGALLAVRRW